MACIIRNSEGEVVGMTTDNNRRSNLFDELNRKTPEIAQDAYAISRSMEFKDEVVKPKIMQHRSQFATPLVERRNDTLTLDEVTQQLQKTGLASGVNILSPQQIEQELVKRGVDSNVARQVAYNEEGVEINLDGKKLNLYHSTANMLIGDFRIRNRYGYYGIYFARTKKDSKTFGDRTYKVSIKPKNTLIIQDNEVKKYNFFNISKESYDKYIEEGFDSIAWYQKGKIKEFVVLDTKIIGDRQIQFQKAGLGVLPNGFVDLKTKEVFLNQETANLDTPIHEFSHLYTNLLKQTNPELYRRGLELIEKEGQEYINFVKQNQPNLEGEVLLEEALTQAVGEAGAKIVNKQSSFFQWLQDMWNSLKDMLGLSQYSWNEVKDMNLQQFTEAMAVDLLRGEEVKFDTNKAFNEVINQLNKTFPDTKVHQLNSEQIDNKLKELGVSEEVRKQVVAWHGTVKNIEDNRLSADNSKNFGELLSGLYFGERRVSQSFAGITPFGDIQETSKIFKVKIDDSTFPVIDMRGESPTNDEALQNIISQKEYENLLDKKRRGEIKGIRLINAVEHLYGESSSPTQYVVFDETVVENIKVYEGELLKSIIDPLFQKGIEVTVNGFVHNGEVYLNTDNLNPETPIHEFAHIYNSWLKDNRPYTYQRGIELINEELTKENSDIKSVIDYVKATQPNLNGESLSEEILAQLIGERGVELINSNKKGGIVEWIKNVWNEIRNLLGLSSLSIEQVANLTAQDFAEMAATDLLKGERLTSEMESIKERAIADGTFMKAPNGKDTNLNERQWLQVRTKAFMDWFGDWINDPQNASKVVDENGEPLVVYRGDNEEFTEFDKSKTKGARYGKLFNLTSDKSFAYQHGNLRSFFVNSRNPLDIDNIGNVEIDKLIEGVNKSLEKPMSKTSEDNFRKDPYKLINRIIRSDRLITALSYAGYTGVQELSYNGVQAVVDPNQIKSATDNVGTFSSESNDIRYQVTGEQNAGLTPNRDVQVYITPATIRNFNEETLRLKELTNEYNNVAKEISQGNLENQEEFTNLQHKILDAYQEHIKEKVSKIRGVNVNFNPPYLGSWEGNYEPSLNMTLSISPNADTGAISGLLFDIAENTSQDAFILEERSEIEDRTPLTEFDEAGMMHYPQIRVNFDSQLSVAEKSIIAQRLKNSGVEEFSIDGDYFIVSIIDFNSETNEQKEKHFTEKATAITTPFRGEGEKIGTNRVRDVQKHFRKSKYVGARNEGDEQSQTREYDRRDLFEAQSPNIEYQTVGEQGTQNLDQVSNEDTPRSVQLTVVTDLSGNQTEVDSSSIITYETEVGPIHYILDSNRDMQMVRLGEQTAPEAMVEDLLRNDKILEEEGADRNYKLSTNVVEVNGFRTIQLLRGEEVLGYVRTQPFEDGVEIKRSILTEGTQRGQDIGTKMYKLAIQDAIERGLPIYSDHSQTEDAKGVWNKLVEEGLAEYDTETERFKVSPLPKSLDNNGEPSAKDVYEYINRKNSEGVKVTSKDRVNIIKSLVGFNSTDELLTMLKNAFMPEGYFNPTVKSLTENGYTQLEANNILRNTSIQEQINDTILKIESLPEAISIDSETIEDIDFVTLDTNVIGKMQNENPFKVKQELVEELGGIKDEQIYNDKINEEGLEIAKDMFEEMSQYNSIEVMEFNEDGELINTPKNNTYELLNETMTEDENGIVTTSINNILMYDDIVLETELELTNVLLRQIVVDAVNVGVDLIGLEEVSSTKPIEETKLFLFNLIQTLEGNISIQEFSEIYNEYFNINTEEVRVEKHKNIPPNSVIIKDKTKTAYEMYTDHGLLYMGSNVYKPVNNRQDVEALYDSMVTHPEMFPPQVFEGVNMNNESEVREAIVQYVNEISKNIESENLERASEYVLNHIYFNSTLNHEVYIKSIPEVNNSEYLTTTFIADFYKEGLREKIKESEKYKDFYDNFEINKRGIEYKSTDPISMMIAEEYINENLKNYFTIKKDHNSEELTSFNEETILTDRDVLMNFPQAISKLNKPYEVINTNTIVVENTTEPFVRVEEGLYEMIDSDGNRTYYTRLPINTSPYIQKMNAILTPISIEERSSVIEEPNLVINQEYNKKSAKEKLECNKR